MSQTLRTTAHRAIAATAAATAAFGASALFAATPASAATPVDGTVTATYVKDGTGLKGVLPDATGKRWPAGSFIANVEGTQVETYCIQFTNNDVEKSGTYLGQSWAAAGVKNLAKAADIAARHASMGTPMTDAQWEKAATQVAIWHYTDAVAWDSTGSAKFTARVKELINAAKTVNEAPASYKLTAAAAVTGTGSDAKDVVTATLTTATGAPLAGKKVNVVVAATEVPATTDATGTAKVTIPATDTTRTAKVVLNDTLPAGAVLAPTSGKQKMITGAPVKLTRTASVQLAAAPQGQKTPDATPTKVVVVDPAPTTKPTTKPTVAVTSAPKTTKPAVKPVAKPAPKQPDRLPYTGSDAAPWMVGAALAVAGAGYALRRRLTRR